MKDFNTVYGYEYEYDKERINKDVSSSDKCYRTLSYYTDSDTAAKILKTGQIWISHSKRMNDWQEFSIGLEKIIYFIKQSIIALEKKNNSVSFDKNIGNIKTRNKNKLEFLKGIINEAEQISLKQHSYNRLVGEDKILKKRFGENIFLNYFYPEFYILSLTSKYDLLSQWKMYAGESGIEFGLDFSKTNHFKQGIEALDQSVKMKSKSGFDEKKYPIKIQYAPTKKAIDSILENIEHMDDSIDFQATLLNQIPFFKNSGFSQEQEYRLVFRPYKQEKVELLLDNDTLAKTDIQSEIGYRISNKVLIPYLKIYCGEYVTGNFKKGWPIVSLTVGPGNNQDVVYNSLIHFVEFGNIKVYEFKEDDYKKAILFFYRRFLVSVFNDEAITDIAEEMIQRNYFYDYDEAPNTNRTGVNDYFEAKYSSWDINQDTLNIIKEYKTDSNKKKILNGFYKWLDIEKDFLKLIKQDDFENHVFTELRKFCTNPPITYELGFFNKEFENYCENNHLSTKGIIIRKSKIPYLFN